jgi:hypothetical protein
MESNIIFWLPKARGKFLDLFKGRSRYKIKVQRVDGRREFMIVLAKLEIS